VKGGLLFEDLNILVSDIGRKVHKN
jgi:hypothetical protein